VQLIAGFGNESGIILLSCCGPRSLQSIWGDTTAETNGSPRKQTLGTANGHYYKVPMPQSDTQIGLHNHLQKHKWKNIPHREVCQFYYQTVMQRMASNIPWAFDVELLLTSVKSAVTKICIISWYKNTIVQVVTWDSGEYLVLVTCAMTKYEILPIIFQK
jgi:hypothetical protein